MKDKNIKPYKISGRFGILNHVGSIWSHNTFETREEANRYKAEFEKRNPACDLRRHKIIPVCVTVSALTAPGK